MLPFNTSLIICLFGAISGFSIMISGGTLNYWLAKEQIDIKTIGLLSLVSAPYAINFIWAPVFDTKKLGRLSAFLGQRLSWLCLVQIALVFSIILLSIANPSRNLTFFAIAGFIVSFFSSAQDSILGALRTEVISQKQQGSASGIYIFGYRIGMLLSSSGAILASKYFSWKEIYLAFAAAVSFMAFLVILKLKGWSYILDEEPQNIPPTTGKSGILRFIELVLTPMGNMRFIGAVMLFLILYRLPDNLITQMVNAFLIHIGYDEIAVASIGKFAGVLGAIIGGLIASHIMAQKNIIESVLQFGILHAVAHSCFILQELFGQNLVVLLGVVSFESITGGMAMAAYIALIASLCKGKFRATQYAFLSSMMGFSRSLLPTISGYMVYNFGWNYFFFGATLLTIPSLLLIKLLRRS